MTNDNSLQHNTFLRYIGLSIMAQCACGWLGPKRPYRYQAENDATDHVVATVGY